MIRVAILWHMHQPLYKDPLAGSYRLPWVRMHALKDYYGMVKLTEEFPQLRLTFNLVPSLIDQIQDYADGHARDPFLEMARTPAEQLDDQGRRFLLRYFFQANHQTMIGRFARYRDLLQKFRSHHFDPDRAFRSFTIADLRDLQVLSQLVWFDEYFLTRDPLRSLVARGRNFSRDDQAVVCDVQTGLIAQILPEYRRALERGQVELSTSAYYHPILPLICDTEVARESRPDVHLPRERFRWPQDAREQLQRARARHLEVFGTLPQGLWPSEGGVSDEIAVLAAEMGFRWMATDEGVLERSLGLDFQRDSEGRVTHAGALYTPYRFTGGLQPIHLFFRDHPLSDLIGFVYSQLPPEEAAEDLVRRIRQAGSIQDSCGQDALVTIILDGENAWEYYPENGRPFLRALYHRLTTAPGITTCTFSQALQQHPHAATCSHLVPGSWINANFDVWIGAEEDNRSWDYLHAARTAFEDRQAQTEPVACELALQALMAAEGSDWNWWYGPEHHSENESEFDELYRLHLSHVWQWMGRTPPSNLLQPISHAAPRRVLFEPATGWIHPFIDGKVSSYFEWLGAARYSADRRTAAMHGKRFSMASLMVGYDDKFLYLRVDFLLTRDEVNGEMRFELSGQKEVHLTAQVRQGRLLGLSAGRLQLPPSSKVSVGRILELRYPRADLGADVPYSTIRLRVSHWSDGLPREVLPQEGSLELRFESKEALASIF